MPTRRCARRCGSGRSWSATTARRPPPCRPRGRHHPPTSSSPAPTLAALGTTAARAMRMMPVQTTGWFTSAGTLAWTRPLDDPSQCRRLRRTGPVAHRARRTCVPPTGTAPTPCTTACSPPASRSVSRGAAEVVWLGVAGDQTTFVHEIGHGYGFAHPPCGATGTPDASYPVLTSRTRGIDRRVRTRHLQRCGDAARFDVRLHVVLRATVDVAVPAPAPRAARPPRPGVAPGGVALGPVRRVAGVLAAPRPPRPAAMGTQLGTGCDSNG